MSAKILTQDEVDDLLKGMSYEDNKRDNNFSFVENEDQEISDIEKFDIKSPYLFFTIKNYDKEKTLGSFLISVDHYEKYFHPGFVFEIDATKKSKKSELKNNIYVYYGNKRLGQCFVLGEKVENPYKLTLLIQLFSVYNHV